MNLHIGSALSCLAYIWVYATADPTAEDVEARMWAAPSERCPDIPFPRSYGTVRGNEIVETSGIAASRKTSGLYWLNNDSGDGPKLYGVASSGANLARIFVQGAQAIDWEDISVGPGPVNGSSYIYISDTGTNCVSRDVVQIYRLLEPDIPPAHGQPPDIAVTAERFDISYPDGRHDCEAMFIDPVTHRIYVITKGWLKARIYWVSLDAPHPLVFNFVGQMPLTLATAADISPDGSLIAVRTYGTIYMWHRRPGALVEDAFANTGCVATHQSEQQGEAIAFSADGKAYLTTSEGYYVPIWYYSLPPTFESDMQARYSVESTPTSQAIIIP